MKSLRGEHSGALDRALKGKGSRQRDRKKRDLEELERSIKADLAQGIWKHQ